jgi:hypothetical protein
MLNLSETLRVIGRGTAALALLVVAGHFSQIHAQRDPFAKASYMKPKATGPTGTASGKSGKAGNATAANYGPPPIEARIEYYKRQREAAAANGSQLPKVTSVLTLNEMAVTGIFKTPRGWAAMVEATPIKLSYTIYPGEKFFDGQLVAVEENRLVFRRVTKTGPNKFVASVENKALQQYTTKAQIEGTAPAQAGSDKPAQTASTSGSATSAPPSPTSFISPLDEMNNQPAASEKPKAKKTTKKPVKVAKNTE